MHELELLSEAHRPEQFDSGSPVLDDWLRRSALLVQAKRTARVFVWADDDRRVVAYVALAPHVIERDSLPKRAARGDPRQIPAILLAKLALDRSLQGQGLGSSLLVETLRLMVAAADRVGGRYLVVDALNQDAAEFYMRHDFIASATPGRLVMRVADAAVSLGGGE